MGTGTQTDLQNSTAEEAHEAGGPEEDRLSGQVPLVGTLGRSRAWHRTKSWDILDDLGDRGRMQGSGHLVEHFRANAQEFDII